ncbi:MAG: hypothetical protein CRU72_09790, partial [Candidatus Accumulibacter phosphatis]|nr:hypothetical protein [Candidatus Accumulibacter phosphatis]
MAFKRLREGPVAQRGRFVRSAWLFLAVGFVSAVWTSLASLISCRQVSLPQEAGMGILDWFMNRPAQFDT